VALDVGPRGIFLRRGYSVLDEIHQAFVASRTASPYDSLLDSIGAFAAFVVLWMWSAGDIPKAKQKYRQVTSLPFDSRFGGRQGT